MSEQLWSDERITRAALEFMRREGAHSTDAVEMIARQLRDDLQARIADLEAQVTALEHVQRGDTAKEQQFMQQQQRIAELEAQLAAMRERVASDHYAMSQAIGKSIGYPAEEYGVETGEQVLISLVDEIVDRHTRLLAQLAAVTECAEGFQATAYQAMQERKAALAQLAAASGWEPVKYNDIINLDNGNELRVVIDQSDKDKRVHLHVRKRMMGEWGHVAVTTIAPDFAIFRRRTQPQPAAGE